MLDLPGLKIEAMETLDTARALNPGSQLWLLASLEASSWTRKLDWYLSFQIRRSGSHRAIDVSPELKVVIEDSEFDDSELQSSATENAPLMIASPTLLPNRQTVVVKFTNEQEWVLACAKIWAGLGQPACRVFLPDSMSVKSFERFWAAGKKTSIEVVAADPAFSISGLS